MLFKNGLFYYSKLFAFQGNVKKLNHKILFIEKRIEDKKAARKYLLQIK